MPANSSRSLREHLVALCERTDLLPGADEQMFIDIDSLLRPVYGHAKQGASYGHTKIAGKQILRKGLSPLATTISTAGSAPVIAGLRLRAGRADSAKGAGTHGRPGDQHRPRHQRRQQILVRGDSAFGSRAVVRTCIRHGAQFSVAMTRNSAIDKAIAAIGERRLDPGALSRRGARSRHRRLDLRCRGRRNPLYRFRIHPRCDHRPTDRAPGQRRPLPRCAVPGLAVSPVLHQHRPPVDQADITHRQHAIIETVFADLIDGPLAHLPSGRFGANSAWVLCAAIAHNLLRAAGVLAGDQHTRARGSTLRRRIINVPARLARPQRRPILHLPTHWPWSKHWLQLWHNTIGLQPTTSRDILTTRRQARPEQTGKAGQTSRHSMPTTRKIKINTTPTPLNVSPSVDRG